MKRESICGTVCIQCGFRERFGCKGCLAMEGNPFWGQCQLYICAAEKGIAHCGGCGGFPCEQLQKAIREGHQPHRMENLIRWREEDQEKRS